MAFLLVIYVYVKTAYFHLNLESIKCTNRVFEVAQPILRIPTTSKTRCSPLNPAIYVLFCVQILSIQQCKIDPCMVLKVRPDNQGGSRIKEWGFNSEDLFTQYDLRQL